MFGECSKSENKSQNEEKKTDDKHHPIKIPGIVDYGM